MWLRMFTLSHMHIQRKSDLGNFWKHIGLLCIDIANVGLPWLKSNWRHTCPGPELFLNTPPQRIPWFKTDREREKEREGIQGNEEEEERAGGEEGQKWREEIRLVFLCFCGKHLSCVIYKSSVTQLLWGWIHKHRTDRRHKYDFLTGFRGHAWWKKTLVLKPQRL